MPFPFRNDLKSVFGGPATRLSLTTKNDADLPGGVAWGLLVGTAGTANLMDAAGNILTNVPLQVGYNPIAVKQVRTGGTATNIWAMY